MVHTILKLSDLTDKVVRLSSTSIYRLIEAGEFPPPIKLSSRSSGWIASEVNDWVITRIEKSRGG